MSSSSSYRHLYPFIFPSVTCFRKPFLRKMWPIQLAFFHFIVCRIFLFFLTLRNTFSFLTRSVKLIFTILLQHHILKTFQVFLIYFLKCTSFSTIQSCALHVALHQFLTYMQVQFTGEKSFYLVECCFRHGNSAFHWSCLFSSVPKEHVSDSIIFRPQVRQRRGLYVIGYFMSC